MSACVVFEIIHIAFSKQKTAVPKNRPSFPIFPGKGFELTPFLVPHR